MTDTHEQLASSARRSRWAAPADLGTPTVRVHGWEGLFGGGAPSVVLRLALHDRLRVVLLEGDDTASWRGRASTPARSALDPAEAADRLVDDAGGDRVSVVVADALVGGHVLAAARHAPPPLLLRAGLPARVLAAGPDETTARARALPGDVLLVCSALALEQPPAALRRLRGAPSDELDPDGVRRAVCRGCRTGAAAGLRYGPVTSGTVTSGPVTTGTVTSGPAPS